MCAGRVCTAREPLLRSGRTPVFRRLCATVPARVRFGSVPVACAACAAVFPLDAHRALERMRPCDPSSSDFRPSFCCARISDPAAVASDARIPGSSGPHPHSPSVPPACRMVRRAVCGLSCCVGCSGLGFVRSASAQPVRSARVSSGPTGGLRPKLLRRMLGSRVRPVRIRTARPFRPRVERSDERFAAGPVAARISRCPLRRNPQAVFRARRGRFPRCVRRGGYGPFRLGTV